MNNQVSDTSSGEPLVYRAIVETAYYKCCIEKMTFGIITVMLTSSCNMQIYFPCLNYTFQVSKIFSHITGL